MDSASCAAQRISGAGDGAAADTGGSRGCSAAAGIGRNHDRTCVATGDRKAPRHRHSPANRVAGATNFFYLNRRADRGNGLCSFRDHILEDDRNSSGPAPDFRDLRGTVRRILGCVPISATCIFGNYGGIAAGRGRVGRFRRKSSKPKPAPLASVCILSLGNFSWHGIRLGPARRGLAVLARPHYAHLSGEAARWRVGG